MDLETGAEPPVEYGVFQSGLGVEAEMANRTNLYEYLKGCPNPDLLYLAKQLLHILGQDVDDAWLRANLKRVKRRYVRSSKQGVAGSFEGVATLL